VKETLFALDKHNDKSLIFTLPGADQHNLIIFNKLYKFAKNRNNVHIFKSLGSQNYLSLLKISDGLIGNSSSGIIEMPTFRKPTINIGKRQEGRVQSQSIINVDVNRKEINKKINFIYQKKIKTNIKNPFKKNFTSKKIVSLIKNLKVDKLSPKKFFDVSFKL
jgi:GDP/UDP-N,N'-diacetylbacillosamine 2-epimerase (hydrolysing)